MATVKPQMGLVTAIIAPQINSDPYEEVKEIKEQVREIMDHTVEYVSIDDCEEFIRSNRYEYIFIIATDHVINDVFNRNLHQIRHVQSIFLFDPCKRIDAADIDNLRKSSFKMQERFHSSNDLIQCISKCVHDCVNHSDILLSSLSGCSADAMTTNVVNNIADFAELWFPLYIDLLLELPIVDPDGEVRRFVDQCQRHLVHSPGALEVIKELGEIYISPHGALYYYSCDGPVYRLVNRALRRQAVNGILDFRFLLLDIREQLQLAHRYFFLDEDTKVGALKKFFRGQRMSHKEIQELERKHIEGTLITTNSYFSTSESSDIARKFAGEPTADMVSVLFEITAKIKDPNIRQRKPFAKIGSFSNFGEAEREVLFSIGSFFKIDQIDQESPSFWIVKVTFVDEDADEKQDVIEDYRTLRTCSSEAKLIKIGHLLANHPHQGISQAKTFYQLMMTSPFSETFEGACTAGLGWLALKERDGTSAFELQLKALGLYEQLPKCNSEDLTHLYITSYNCMGASLRLIKRYRRALEYYKKAEELLLKVPIDKYAMYDGYRNITSINIASIHKLMGEIDPAWESYKQILAHEMNNSTRFHGHTYLTIAQAGLYEAKMANDTDQYERCSHTWKSFLDKSLTNMSGSYRRSIISGLLLLGFEYADNEQRQTMAIDYFQKLIHISRRYAKANPDDYHIVLRCLNQLARLYTKKKAYDTSIQYAVEALNMCREDGVQNLRECYESMVQNYEQQLVDQTDDLTPDVISKMIVENPLLRVLASKDTKTISAVVFTFKRNEFTFGQHSTKTMDPKILEEPDLQRRLAYCRLKVAALAQAQGYKNAEEAERTSDDLLAKKAQKDIERAHALLKTVAKSLPDDPQVQQICANNISYMYEDFDSIIHIYQKDLNYMQQKNNLCIGEDAFCYIAHLYARKNRIEEVDRWYNAAIQYFESHGHICEHTVVCFRRLVHFYEKHQNAIAAIDILRRLADYLLKHSPHSFLRTAIAPIVMNIVQYFNEKHDSKQVILILQDLIDIILTEPANDVSRIDEQFRELIVKCKDDPLIVNKAYGSYLEILLQYKPLPLDSYIRAVEPAFRQAIAVYHTCNNHRKLIETYQQFIELLVRSTTNRQSTEDAFKRLATDFENLKSYDVALDMYSYLGNFIVKYQKNADLVLAGFVIVRCKFLKLKSAVLIETVQQMLIQLMRYYHNNAEPQFIFSEYFQSRYVYVDRCSCIGVYQDLLEFCFQCRSELYENHMKTNVLNLATRPTELIAFITTNRVNYTPLILHIFDTFKKQPEENFSSKRSPSDFETAAVEWLSSIETNRTVFWSELLHRLLELQSTDDECLAMCYTNTGNVNAAVSLFSTDIYGDPALQFSSNACRRYLRYVYPQASVEERMNFERRYYRHFFVECDSFTDQMSYEVLPNE